MTTHAKTHDETAKTGRPAHVKAPAESKAKDAVALLKQDHRLVEDLFEKFEATSKAAEKQQLILKICHELTVHAVLEENFFYPKVREALKKENDMIDEAVVEHSSLKWLIAQLESEALDSELYEAKVTVLKEYVEHHVKEEEKELFPKVQKSTLDIVELGDTMQAAKKVLQKELAH